VTQLGTILVRVPDAPPQLLPGKTAIYWLRRFLACAAVLVPSVLLMPVASLLPIPARHIVLGCLLAVILAVCSVGIRASIEWARTEMRERDAGYTTQYNKRYELWQLDSTTGEVLRRPGERQVRKRR
jgi:hypothetical protein